MRALKLDIAFMNAVSANIDNEVTEEILKDCSNQINEVMDEVRKTLGLHKL